MLRSDQLKYTSSSIRDNGRKSYQMKEDTSIHVDEPTTKDINHERKHESEKDKLPLPTHPSRMLEDCIESVLIKRIQGKEYDPNEGKPNWYKESALCRYHQVKGYHTLGYFVMRKYKSNLWIIGQYYMKMI